MRTFKVLTIGVLLAAGAVGAVAGLRIAYAHVAARHWRSRVQAVAESDVDKVIEEAVTSGSAGLGVAVETLGAPRAILAEAALRALRRRLAAWQDSPSPTSAARQVELARALAEQAPGFGPGGRRRAARLARGILLWLPHKLPVDRAAVIADCDRVLAVARPAGGDPVSSPLIESGIASQQSGLPEETAPSPFELAARGSAGWTPEPLVPLPVTVEPESPVADQVGDEAESAPAESDPAPEDDGVENGSPSPLAGSTPSTASDETPQPALEPPALRLPDEIHREAVPIPEEDLRTLETVEVMRKLQESGPVGAAARDELVRRGFTPVHLELAGRLFAPNAQTRAELVRLLPRLESADPQPWLWQLAQDSESRIREAAISALATGGDATTLDRLEELARSDPDPQIRQQAAQIARIRQQRLR